MIGDKQIGNGSVGIQADRDVTVNVGLVVAEVETLTKLFLKENFPKLRQDAMEAVRENVQQFMSKFEAQLGKRFSEVDVAKFRDPDVQFSLNEAVLETAKRGDAANIDLLVTLVLERVAKDGGGTLSRAVPTSALLQESDTIYHPAFALRRTSHRVYQCSMFGRRRTPAHIVLTRGPYRRQR